MENTGLKNLVSEEVRTLVKILNGYGDLAEFMVDYLDHKITEMTPCETDTIKEHNEKVAKAHAYMDVANTMREGLHRFVEVHSERR